MAKKQTVPEQKTESTNVHTDNFVERNANAIAYSIIGLTTLVILLLFNVKLDLGGDDATYICRALDFLSAGTYPSFQGPLYPLFLSAIIAISGGSSNVIMLKFTSVIMMVLAQLAMWWSLRKSVSPKLLLCVLAMMAFNVIMLRFGSLTYSEPFFMLIQWLAVGIILRFEGASTSNRKRFLLLATLAGVLIITSALVRTVGYGWALSAIVFLLVRRKWRHTAALLASLVVSFGVWTGIKSAVWGNAASNGNQMQTLLQVDPYNADKGLESPTGYLKRLWSNTELYVSKHYVKMLGFRATESREKSVPVGLAVVALMAYGGVVAIRKDNAPMTLVAIATAILLGITFFSLQEIWDQARLIIPFIGMMIVLTLYAVKELLEQIIPSKAKMLTLIFVGLSTLCSATRAIGNIDLLTIRHNLSGNTLYGYTPDWYNYLSMCQKIGADANADTMYVACRKPNMARIYSGGKKFQGIYNVPTQDPDELVETLRSRGVTHVIVASLRRDPMQAGLGVINTVHYYLSYILDKYPDFLEQVDMCGTVNSEPAYLLKIHYEALQNPVESQPNDTEPK